MKYLILVVFDFSMSYISFSVYGVHKVVPGFGIVVV
jgi:hypothetical protein